MAVNAKSLKNTLSPYTNGVSHEKHDNAHAVDLTETVREFRTPVVPVSQTLI